MLSVWHKEPVTNALNTAFSNWLIAIQFSVPILLYIPFFLWYILVLIKSSHCLLNKISRLLAQTHSLFRWVEAHKASTHFTSLLGSMLALQRMLLMSKYIHSLFFYILFCSAILRYRCRNKHTYLVFLFSLCVQHTNFSSSTIFVWLIMKL